MNISRDQFRQIINGIIIQRSHDAHIARALDEVVKHGDNHSLIFRTPLVDYIVEALDYDGIISWWLWDGPDAGARAEEFAVYLGDPEDENCERLAIHDAEELYDYMERVSSEQS